MLTDLCRIASRYGTDKVGHGYTGFYDLLLNPRRAQIRTVLEIGIGSPAAMQHVPDYQTGASLRMWAEYFPQAFIYGLDLNPDCLFETERIQTLLADQREPDELLSAVRWWNVGSFDLIVDDGLHDSISQALTAILLVPHLSRGGIYIIEDCAFPEQVSAALPFEHSITTFQASGTKRDDRLILIRDQALC